MFPTSLHPVINDRIFSCARLGEYIESSGVPPAKPGLAILVLIALAWKENYIFKFIENGMK